MKIRKMAIAMVGIVGIYLVYAFSSAVLLFSFHQPILKELEETEKMEQTYHVRNSGDRVVLVEGRTDAAIARIHLIENATLTLDIAYYILHGGKASNTFIASIVDAADRGVQVRVLLDGLFHNLRGDRKHVISAFTYHPNIELKFYEPFDPLRPWTWNNRLHDKLMIADNELAMIGGRNIGDAYFAPDGYIGATNDRDVVIVNPSLEERSDSVINEMSSYFDLLWDHDFSKTPMLNLSKRQQEVGGEKLAQLRKDLVARQESHQAFFHQKIDWIDKSVPTNNITFLFNPIERFNKEPLVWMEIVRLIEQAEDSIRIQSPYIIPTPEMLQYMDGEKVTASHITMVTNSLAATPNVIAFSGYMHHRESLVTGGVNLYEYQGPFESLHTKTFLFDNRITVIGSFNLDPRSAFLSTESVVMIDSEEFATLVVHEIDGIIQHGSLLVNDDGTYAPSPHVREQRASIGKIAITKGLSFITRFFQYML